MRDDNSWIQTYTGLKAWPLDLCPEDIDIRDIAHALSLQCRFTGHVKQFYSVAQHSVHVSHECDFKDRLWGLLHDASETYLIDLARPVKYHPKMTVFREAEERALKIIAERFGLSMPEPDSVKAADRRLLLAERRDLLVQVSWSEGQRHAWDVEGEPRKERIVPWTSEKAETEFLSRFYQLTSTQADGEF